MTKKFAVIVDGLSSGVALAPAFRALGLGCIHILSSANLPPGFVARLIKADFDLCLEATDEPKSILEKLKDFDICVVTPGADSGVYLADFLSNALNLQNANSFETNYLRSSKFEAIEHLRRIGIPAPAQLKVSSPDHLTDEFAGFSYPVVCKPIGSGGSDNVFICDTAEQAKVALTKIFTSKTVYGYQNDSALIQEKMNGPEFMVDSVSSNGVHRHLMVWRVNRMKTGTPFGLVNYQMSPNEPEYRAVTDYVDKVLDALGFEWGAANTEIMLTEQGPKLIELNSRLHGSFSQLTAARSIGTSQAAETARAYLSPKAFATDTRYLQPQAFVAKVYLKSTTAGDLKTEPNWRNIPKLKSYCGIYTRLSKGKNIQITKDLATSPGVVYLAADTAEDLKSDYETIRSLEQTDLYSAMVGEKNEYV